MKSKIFCAIVFMFNGELLLSQQLNTKNISDQFPGYWSLSYSAGIGGNITKNNFVQGKGSGFTYGIDASYSPENNIGFFANYSSTNIDGEYIDDYYSEIINTGKLNYSQISFGPRLFSNNKNLFIDAGIGYFNIANSKSIGLNAGAGVKIRFSDSYGITFNGRIYNGFVKKDPFLYYSVFLRFELNNSSDKNSLKNSFKNESENRLSLTAFGGKYSNSNSYNNNSAFGGELSYDISKKVSLLLNYIHSNSSYFSKIVYTENINLNQNFSSSENDITGGVRFYLTGNKLRFFVENYTGIYMSAKGYENSLSGIDTINYNNSFSESENYFGLSFGTGVDFKILKNVSGIFKIDAGTYFRGSYYSTVLGGLKYNFWNSLWK